MQACLRASGYKIEKCSVRALQTVTAGYSARALTPAHMLQTQVEALRKCCEENDGASVHCEFDPREVNKRRT